VSARTIALAHYRHRARLARAMERHAARLWRQVDPANIAGSWELLLWQLLPALTAAQADAAGEASDYVAAVLRAQGVAVEPVAVNAATLAGVASDGRELDVLLRQPVITTKTALQRGATMTRALASGQAALRMIVGTQVADAGRVADGVATAAQRSATGYVRMLVGSSCSRCVILAGKRFRWNRGFDRHPRCDCIHVPAAETDPADIRVNPKAYFDSLSREEQDRVFTKAGAQAIRDGADINQVVNARRGAHGLAPAGARVTAEELRMLRGGRQRGRLEAVEVDGQRVYITREGVTVRGIAGRRLMAVEGGSGQRRRGDRYRSARTPRLMPESIYQIAGNDRDEAIRLLRRFGYIL